MSNRSDAHRRLHKSAKMLKAFFEAKLNISLELLTEGPAHTHSYDMPFEPYLNAYSLWGFRPNRPLNDGDRTQIAEMCESILGSFEAMHRQREELEDLERHLIGTVSEELPSNVIALQRRPITQRTETTPGWQKRYSLKMDCLIESPNVADIHKMALELHDHSHRIAFIHFWALNPRNRMSFSQLLSMGAITLYIPNILKLTSLEQEILRHVVLQDTLHRPLLMVGTPISYADLSQNESIDADLLSLLSRAYIKLSKPFSEYKDQGLIHYFLDSLSSSPT